MFSDSIQRVVNLRDVSRHVFLISDTARCNHLLKLHDVAMESFIGLDTEWRPSILNPDRKPGPTSVLQLATSSAVYIVQLRRCVNILGEQEIPIELQSILESHSCLKVGFHVSGDVKKLSQVQVSVNNFLDVEKLYHTPISLNKLFKRVFNINMKKSKSITLSDWEADLLSEVQITYAAIDAIAVYDLFEKIKDSNYDESPCCSKVLPNPGIKSGKKSERSVHKAERFRKYAIESSMKKPLYDNCCLLAPDGSLLSMIPRKRMLWYLSNNLAEEIEGLDRPTISLNFEPKGRNSGDDDYFVEAKANQCVCCGEKEYLTRHYIVPFSFRQHFPMEYKSHSSHDIVVLCANCGITAARSTQQLRQVLVLRYFGYRKDVRDLLCNKKGYVDSALNEAKKAASALLKSGSKMPQKRKLILVQRILTAIPHVDIENLQEELPDIATIDTFIPFEEYRPVEQLICEKILLEGNVHNNLCSFIIEWREKFLRDCEPKYLPKSWSVNHRIG